MENKSKTNTVLLVIIIILLVLVLGYLLLNNPKGKEDNSLINDVPQENLNNQEDEVNDNPIMPPISPNNSNNNDNTEDNLVSVTTDPYLSNMTSNGAMVGAPSYFLVKKDITSDNVMYYYKVYTDIYSLEVSGERYLKDGKIYYNPTEENVVVKFGSEVSADPVSFRESVNDEIKKSGYALIKNFWNGGPMFIDYTLIK